jgi:hypothetical protein
VRILENPEDSFEDAHPFPRCARKVRIFAEGRHSRREADRWLRLTALGGCSYVQAEGTIF